MSTAQAPAPSRRSFMDEHRFDILLTLALLAGGVWYVLRMLAYPSTAGRVPAIVGAIMVVAALVQLAIQLVRYRRRDSAVAPAAEEERVPRAEQEPEMDTYATLIALAPERRRKFLAIVAFSIAFYFGIILAGFVVTSAVLITAILLISRERVWVAVVGGVAGGAAAYGLVVGVMNAQPLTGLLFR